MQTIAFIGGGNMATALIGGLVAAGHEGRSIIVVEPVEAQRRDLCERFGVEAIEVIGPALARASMVVWAVKPQVFGAAAAKCASHVRGALQVSVMAGVRSDAIAAATGSERVVRVMPNTPALIGKGVAGVFARPAVSRDDRASVDAVLAPTGAVVWLEREDELDAITALSGSGPAYVFHLVEAMVAAAREMGVPDDRARTLAVHTVAGAAALAAASNESAEVLRRNVTSPGGTTAAAMAVLEKRGVEAAFIEAILAARDRARELGEEFGATPDAPGDRAAS